MKARYWIVIPLLFFNLIAAAQQRRVLEIDTAWLGIYQGKQRFQVIETDGRTIKHGFFVFESGLLAPEGSDRIQKFELKGNYREGLPQGQWESSRTETSLELRSVKGETNLQLDYSLDGLERIGRFNFKNGVPHGDWQIEVNRIERNKKSPTGSSSQFRFQEGIASGAFSFKSYSKPVVLRGILDAKGFLDGELFLEYETESNIVVQEIRRYAGGFLLEISKTRKDDTAPYLVLEFEDVKQKLQEIQDGSNEGRFTISDKGFGTTFQNGYESQDPHLLHQVEGNLLLDDLIDRYKEMANKVPSKVSGPDFPMTRRFKFYYADLEDNVLALAAARLRVMRATYNDFLSDPRFLLQRDRVDSLPFVFGFLEHALGKIDTLLEVNALIEDGFFDHLYRDMYFRNGISGLEKPDSFVYRTGGKSIEKTFDLGVYIDSPDDLVQKIDKYTEILKQQSDKYLEKAFNSVKLFENQYAVDSLDRSIVALRTKAEALYGFYQVIPADRKFEEMPVDYRVFKVLDKNLLGLLMEQYLDTEISTEAKIKKGEELTCLLLYLTDNHATISGFGEMRERLAAKFTRYSPNPFFERDVESRILPNIYQKGTGILLEDYVLQMYQAKSCADLGERIGKISRLEKRLTELSALSNQIEIERLDRALRRENIPVRIERLLGLENSK